MSDNGIVGSDSYLVGMFMYLFKHSPMKKMKEVSWDGL